MPDLSMHPTAQALALFGNGKLSAAQAATVAAHLESCADCRNAVAGLPPDSLMGKVRAAKPSGTQLPPGPAPVRLAAAPSSAGRPAAPSAPLANVPPELVNHPKFRLIRELGRGGMGVIYLAEHRVMEKHVALKVISPAVLDNPDALARFHAEVKAAGKLDHPNIARAHDADQAGNLHFLVMEYVEGVSLAQLVEKKGPLPVAHACHFIRQAALGLQHASEKGMVHRDIKPQNLMVAPRSVVKVLDFGLARLRSERKGKPGLTQADSFMGTPEYVAPEQATDARTADTRADIYSLGCTLYALLTGRPPFQEDTLVKLVLAHIEKEPQPLHEVRPDVPPELSAVVARMLAKDPAQRYQRPVEVAQALVPFIKAGGKEGASNAMSVPPGVASAGTGTRIGGDTSRVKGLGQGEAKRPAKASVEEEKESRFSDLMDAPAAAPVLKKARKELKEAKPAPAVWWKRPVVLAGAVSASLALILMAVVIIKIKVAPSPEGIASPGDTGKPIEETFVILEINQPDAEVSVDGQKITITIPGDNKPVRIKVEPGHRKLRISKDGFEVVTEDVELKAGQKSEPIKVRLERKVAELPKKADNDLVKPDAPAAEPQPPKGFTALFNGKDLSGWHGMPHFDPYKLAAMPEDQRKAQIEKWTDDAKIYWSVDKGELVNDGNGPYLTTNKDYGDIELLIDYKTVPLADSGIYLRATPQVQIWDYTKEGGKWNLGADKGSGGLWNNSAGAPGKDPLVLADKPFGQWNHFRILMVGDRVTVYLNDKLVVDHARLENFWDKTKALPKAGPIQLQTHGGEIRWRNVFIREIPSAEPSKDPAPPADDIKPFFNGKNLNGWDGLPGYWRVEDGAIVGACPPGQPAHTFLVSQKPYKDFDLKFQVRRKDGVGNSGVQFRSQMKDRGRFTVVGPQCEIDSANFAFPPGSLVTEPDLKPLAVKAPGAAIAKAYKDANFNAFHIRCIGKHVTIKVNGVTAIDGDYPGVPDEGVIAWQIHGTMTPRELTFKDIEFTDLSDGFKPLFNGKDLNGWQVFGGGTGAWKVNQGILVGSGPVSHLFSPRGDYENFHLIAEAMINDGGNSGQYFRTQFGPGYPKGYEAQINATHGDPIRTGSLYPSFPGLTVEQKREISVYEQLHGPGVWFTQEVIAEGNHIVIKVNGDKTVDFADRNNTYAKGHFALQQHDQKTLVKFRKIEIKELPAK